MGEHMIPKILISGNAKLQYYLSAVEKSGAVGVAGYLPKNDDSFDGLLLCGGNDINPCVYGQGVDGAVDFDDDRDKWELSLLQSFVNRGKPVFGICRGFQLLNVYFGGTMCQHLKNADYHTNKSNFYITHPVISVYGTLCNRLYGREFVVNSSHHQCLDKLAPCFDAQVYSGDVIEFIHHKTLPVFGCQWHPERMCYDESRNDTVDGKLLFLYFLDLCSKDSCNSMEV